VLTRLPIYISLAVNYFQNKIIFLDSSKITGRGGDFQVNVLQRGDFTKKVEDH